MYCTGWVPTTNACVRTWGMRSTEFVGRPRVRGRCVMERLRGLVGIMRWDDTTLVIS